MTDLATDALLELRDALRQSVPEDGMSWLRAPKNLALALSVAGVRLLEPFQWCTDAESAAVASRMHARMVDQMADILLYLILLADNLKVDLAAAAWEKISIEPCAQSRQTP